MQHDPASLAHFPGYVSTIIIGMNLEAFTRFFKVFGVQRGLGTVEKVRRFSPLRARTSASLRSVGWSAIRTGVDERGWKRLFGGRNGA
jgi:hypothetical protein